MASEVEAAKEARGNRSDTIFGKITRGEIPCSFIYEDSQVRIWFTLIQSVPVYSPSRCWAPLLRTASTASYFIEFPR